MQERMGTVEVLLEQTDEVLRERNGKFRSVLCNVPTEEWEHLRKTGPVSSLPCPAFVFSTD